MVTIKIVLDAGTKFELEGVDYELASDAIVMADADQLNKDSETPDEGAEAPADEVKPEEGGPETEKEPEGEKPDGPAEVAPEAPKEEEK